MHLRSRAASAAVPVLVILATVALVACTSGGAASSTTPGSPAASAQGGASPASSLAVGPQVGSLAPELALTDLDGKPVKLSDYAGKPVVLNYWASWCGPCRDEFPELKAALEQHAADGLVVLGVLFKDDVEPAKAFVEKQGATWPSLADPNDVAANAYRVVAPPQTFFIGRDGVIRDLQIGGMTGDQLARHLATILQ